MAKCFSGLLRILFSNNVYVKVAIDPLLNDFRSDSVVFFLFPSLSSCSRVSSRSIYYILNFFFLKYGLNKVSPLRLIIKAAENFSFAFAVIVFVSYFADLDDLKEGKNVILTLVHILDLII